MSLEKQILKKQYNYINNSSTIWSFKKKDDELKQINLEYNKDSNKYKFTFPINNIHFSTSFKDSKKLKKYISYILHSHTL